LVRDGATGFVAVDDDFSSVVAQVLNNPALHANMRVYARQDAMKASWDAVFEKVYAAYLPVALSGSATNAA
jgi:glycosyltransferase involved in cell wall biosynthesis